jgi:hypothetical protein
MSKVAVASTTPVSGDQTKGVISYPQTPTEIDKALVAKYNLKAARTIDDCEMIIEHMKSEYSGKFIDDLIILLWI